MNKLMTMSLMVTLSLGLAGCFNSGSEESPPPAVEPPPTGLVANGATYYATNCGSCHSAGTDDTTNAFGASDLAQKQDMITNDMSTYDQSSGFDLMTVFSDLPDQRVADLKSYLSTVPQNVAALR
jgi:mono/diheme cytochrome c family protein